MHRDNETRIAVLNIQKVPYLFTSADLLQILAITASVKTRITFIKMIGPRLTDPKAKSAEIIGMFRYSEEKRQVEDVLKARAQTVSTTAFSVKPAGGVLAGGGRGAGRGGRGPAGRGAGRGPAAGGRGSSSSSVPSSSVPTIETTEETAKDEPILSFAAESTSAEKNDNSSISKQDTDVTPETKDTTSAETTPVEPVIVVPVEIESRGPRKSRKSSIVINASVMSSLGLGDSINDRENLDDVPCEIWEMKCDPKALPQSESSSATLKKDNVLQTQKSADFDDIEYKSKVMFQSAPAEDNDNTDNDNSNSNHNDDKPSTTVSSPEQPVEEVGGMPSFIIFYLVILHYLHCVRYSRMVCSTNIISKYFQSTFDQYCIYP
jgi:hypothetical protein